MLPALSASYLRSVCSPSPVRGKNPPLRLGRYMPAEDPSELLLTVETTQANRAPRGPRKHRGPLHTLKTLEDPRGPKPFPYSPLHFLNGRVRLWTTRYPSPTKSSSPPRHTGTRSHVCSHRLQKPQWLFARKPIVLAVQSIVSEKLLLSVMAS